MKTRGRPKKYRIVRTHPRIIQFSPRGRPGRPDEVDLGVDEFEAVRLVDFSGLSQKEAARSMKISQQTLSRVLIRARKALAEALVGGKIIKIQGGVYTLSTKQNPAQARQINPAKEEQIT